MNRNRGIRADECLRSASGPRFRARPRRRFRTWLALRFRRALPARNGELLVLRNGEPARGNLMADGRARADGRPFAHRDRRDELCIRSDMHVVLDDGAVLVRAVVVTGDGAGADVDVAAYARVADVGQVIGFAACTDNARLDLDEISDVHLVGEHGRGPYSRV